ncbi:MAG TPA: class I SAM-dependent methyltransferase [Verrucomicrobiae bacterium]|nr:class I SAM-dependent methyltransferase [Verrucomicrobiae bacterium]
MRIPAITWACELVAAGKTDFLIKEAQMRFHKVFWEIKWKLGGQASVGKLPPRQIEVKVDTKYPIAFESPDHKIPWGTMRDNSTHKRFVSFMGKLIQSENPKASLGALDLGCSGGQLVKDFSDLGWLAVGLEGSDFSLKHKRANWPALAGKNLFTCDITKPFTITNAGELAKFNLVTMWEVLEHIGEKDLKQLFNNITNHMTPGAYFVASTTSGPDIHKGVDLHQTKWTNMQWRQWIGANYPKFRTVDLGLKYYEFVRHNEEASFITLKYA